MEAVVPLPLDGTASAAVADADALVGMNPDETAQVAATAATAAGTKGVNNNNNGTTNDNLVLHACQLGGSRRRKLCSIVTPKSKHARD